MMDDVPLICDPVPGPLDVGVILVNRKLTNREVEAIRLLWERAQRTGATMLLPSDCAIYSTFEPRQWPDAEFCGA